MRSLYHLTRARDPERPVVANDGWEYICGQIHGVHDYTFSPDVIRHRYGSRAAIARTVREQLPSNHFVAFEGDLAQEVAVVISEFGGISIKRDPGDFAWHGYGVVPDEEEFLERYRGLVTAIMDCPTVAGFCYTQLTDTLQERNGLLTEDRVPKVDPAQIAAINSLPRTELPPQTARGWRAAQLPVE